MALFPGGFIDHVNHRFKHFRGFLLHPEKRFLPSPAESAVSRARYPCFIGEVLLSVMLNRKYCRKLFRANTFSQFFQHGISSVDMAFFCSSGGGVSFPLFTSSFRHW